ncbi:MAG: thioredoxin fold domain-containing protein [Arcobacteraceae bacterium]|nr:thioredoxin fold domain-containing protein [Arcobacteraceae bacterium]
MIEINGNLFKKMKKEFKKERIVILQFKSDFCEPCNALEMELEELDDLRDDVSILSIDCAENADELEQFNVYQTPTMIIFNKQKEIIYRSESIILCQDIIDILDR